MRTTTIKTLLGLIAEGHDIHLLTGDLGFGVLNPIMEEYPGRFTNMGVAEANMVGVAAGMAMRGMRVYCYSMVPFLLCRALDQIRCDLCGMNLPVTLIGVGGGLSYGLEGMTHYAIEDIAIARALPNMTVFAPGDPLECRALVKETVSIDGPCYLRLGGNNDPIIHSSDQPIVPGKIAAIGEDGEAAIIANGAMLPRAKMAVEVLSAEGFACRLYSIHTIKPLDEDMIRKIGTECRCIVTVEEHSLINGIGSAVAEVLFNAKYNGNFLKLGLPDEYSKQLGDRDWLRDKHNLRPENIVEAIKQTMGDHEKRIPRIRRSYGIREITDSSKGTRKLIEKPEDVTNI